jgi:hypothetical protein
VYGKWSLKKQEKQKKLTDIIVRYPSKNPMPTPEAKQTGDFPLSSEFRATC